MKVAEYIHGKHSVHDIKYHIVWITKYRYKILTGKVAQRVQELTHTGMSSKRDTVIESSVGKDHIHMLVSAPTNIAPSKIVQYLKGRSSKLLQNGDKNHFKV